LGSVPQPHTNAKLMDTNKMPRIRESEFSVFHSGSEAKSQIDLHVLAGQLRALPAESRRMLRDLLK